MDWPTYFGIFEVAWVIMVAVAILLEDRSPIATLAWIFGLALLPGVGLLVYIVFGPRRLTRKRTRRARARKLIESKAAPSRIRGGQGAAVDQGSAGELGNVLSSLAVRSGEPPPLHCESITLHVEGSDAYDAIIQAIDEAKHHVHLEYYIFEEGKVAERVIDALVRRALAGVEVPAGARIDVDDPLPRVMGHRGTLVQMVRNLLQNAVKFVAPNSPPRVHVCAKPTGTMTRLVVADQGIGIAPADQARVFRPFERLHASEAYAGTGIGLAVCRKIVERHRGTITAQSTPGEGTTFVLTLPVTQENQDSA